MSRLQYQVMDRAGGMAGQWGGYRKVAVVLVDPTALPEGRAEPFAITSHSRGCVAVEEVWHRVYRGKTDRCAHAIALRQARELAARKNRELCQLMVGG